MLLILLDSILMLFICKILNDFKKVSKIHTCT